MEKILNRNKRFVLNFVWLSLTSLFGFTSLVIAEYGAADTDGFQRPKEKKQITSEEESEIVPSSSIKNTNTDSNNEALDSSQDGFKRPKKTN